MDFNELMKQAQQMQQQMGKIEEELQNTEYKGTAGSGVEVVVNGGLEVLEVNIEDELMDVESKDMLQDMILVAVNDAITKANADRAEKLGVMTQGMDIPGLR